MGKSSAPPPPDYAALAAAQQTTNNSSAQYNANLNRVNQYTPTGSSTWSIRPGADPNNPQPGDYTQTTALSAPQQALQNSSDTISQSLANTAQSGLDRVGQAMATPFNTSGLPALQGAPSFSSNAQAGNPVTSLSGAGQGLQGAPTAGGLTSNVSTNGLPSLANGGSYADQVKAVRDATYAQYAPQLAVNRQQAESRLLNSGIEKGTQAWDDAQRNLSNSENQANQAAVLAGSNEQTRLAGLDLQSRQQQFGEGQTNASLNNSAQGQAYSQGLAGASLNNSNQSTAFGQQQSAGAFANAAQNQTFAQQSALDAARNAFGISSAQLSNTARQQGLSEQQFLRQIPLNELNALRTGAQVSAPQFSGYYTGASTAPANVYGAGVDAYNSGLASTNANNASSAQTSSALTGLAAAGLMAF